LRSSDFHLRGPLVRGVVLGGVRAASPLVFFWLDPATVFALGLSLIAAAAAAGGAGVTGSLWLIVAGLAGHGLKDVWQHRTGFVAGTRWWPPFCAVDWVAAALIAVAITSAPQS
jgi:hypothetical protein